MTQQNTTSSLHDASVGELTGELSRQVSRLARDEIHLAQLEMTQKGKRLGAGTGLLAVGGVLAILGLGSLVAAAVVALDLALSAWLSALLVGAGLLVSAGTAALIGRGQMRRATPPVPREAMQSAKDDLQALKGHHR